MIHELSPVGSSSGVWKPTECLDSLLQGQRLTGRNGLCVIEGQSLVSNPIGKARAQHKLCLDF